MAGRTTGCDPYKAVPLKADDGCQPHIRLVKVHRDSSQSRLIHCHFVAYPLAACPPYIALSYTWNCSNAPKETKKETILLQSHPCAIGQNLYSFLRRVRRDSHDRLYWIDALCINQADNAERSHQVRLMRDIYSSAARVIVWLGE
ncbi:heterokaryon incompatibility protein-domain-containing protein, partial [Coniella lustricola]